MFALALWLCSAGVIQKYAGTPAALVYVPLCLGAQLGAGPLCRRASEIPVRLGVIALAAMALVMLAALVIVYPHANAHGASVGSDRDDAATLGARALMRGDYPYTQRTYLGNPISQFPLGLVAAVPFVEVAGSAGYESLVWLPVLLWLLVRVAGSASVAAALALLALAVSPGLWREFLTGGDLIPCVTAVCLCLLYVERTWAWPLLGAALCWRPNLALSAVPFLWHLPRWRALGAIAAAAAVFAVATLPFALQGGFTPWAASDKLEAYNGVVPGGARLLVLAVLAATLAVAWLGLGDVWEQAALPQALVVAAVVGKASADAHRLDLTPLVSGYGALALVPALLALASRSSTHTRFAERLKAAPSARAESSIRGRHRKRASR